MGEFDEFRVAEGNLQNIPYIASGYQSNQLDCYQTRFTISKEGKLGWEKTSDGKGLDLDKQHSLYQAIHSPEGFAGALWFYGDDDNKHWVELNLYVENNQVVYVDKYGEELFCADPARLEFFQTAVNED